ncbi:hypothetical protein RR48_05189 [Papilio machaon]|uniref:FLYWCH-type domain-containing protein n=1 Tax=Papilio machaon TaxID=76193 RepID=A0A0N1IH11_PAPMA|nr:hypothetical protein RR48_05189 [Papilio machaon]
MGKPQLVIGKHRFCERSNNGTIVNWRCTRQPKGCRARVSTLDGCIVRFNDDHNH